MRTLYETAAAKDTIGNDGPDRNAAHTRRLPNRAGSAWLQQSRMAPKMTASI
jgi:hypothetical protein